MAPGLRPHPGWPCGILPGRRSPREESQLVIVRKFSSAWTTLPKWPRCSDLTAHLPQPCHSVLGQAPTPYSFLPRLPSSRSKSALAPFPHSSLRSMGRTNQILPGPCVYPPLCVPHRPRGQPRPSGPGGEDGLTWPLPVFWPHHSATLHIIVALVTLTYLGFPRRAWLAQDSRLCSCESLSGVATPPTPSLLACPLCLHPCLAPLIGDTGRALETG